MHPDREISTALVESMSKYPTLAMMDTADDMARVAAGWVKLCDQMYDIDPYGHQVRRVVGGKLIPRPGIVNIFICALIYYWFSLSFVPYRTDFRLFMRWTDLHCFELSYLTVVYHK